MTRQINRLLVLVAVLTFSGWLAGGSVLAQTTSASVSGKVQTASGSPQADAVVQARSAETGAMRTALTDARGEYRIEGLTSGSWVFVARLATGEISESRSVELRLQQGIRLDFTVGEGLSEKLTVTAHAPLVDRKETAGTLRVSGDQANSLPLAGREFTEVALLDSSVRRVGSEGYSGERGGAFVIHGQTGRANAFLVDGLDNNDRTSGTTLNSYFSQQATQEFVLLTHQYSPEFGQASGGVFNMVTRRGTNETSWSAFAQGTPTGWSSSGEFVDSLPDSDQQAKTSRLQTGFNFGGPFKKDKAFYMLVFEHQRSENVIPWVGWDGDGNQGGRFVGPSENNSLFFRTDFNLTPGNTLMVRLSANDREDGGVNVGGIVTPESGFRIDERDLQLAASLTTIISPRLISETRLLFSDSEFDQLANSDAPGVVRPSGIFGGDHLNSQLRDETKFQVVQNFSLQHKRHTMKFGLNVIRSRTSIDTSFNPNGTFTYQSDRPFEPGDCGFGSQLPDALNYLEDGTVIDTNGNPVCRGVLGVDDDGDGTVDEAANILSYPTVYTRVIGEPSAVLNDTSFSLFAQDRWDLGSRWLLDFGLRYDLSTFVLPESARVDSTVPNGGAGRDTDNIAPRVGFTFTPWANGKTVVRGGAGMFYDKLVLGFPAVASITSGTQIGIMPLQGFSYNYTEEDAEQDGPLSDLAFPPQLILRFSTATEMETPYTAQFSLGIEHSVGPRGVAKLNLIRSQGYHIPLLRDINPVIGLIDVRQGVDCPGSVDPDMETGGIPCHGPDPDTGSIAAVTTTGRSWYTGLDLGYRWQGEQGWLSASYTLSGAEDLGFDPLKGGIALPPDSADLTLERGRSDGDRRHRLVIAADSPLPFWDMRISGVLQLSSGLPFDVTTGVDSNNDGIMNDRLPGEHRNSGASTPLSAINEVRADENKTLNPDQQLDVVTSLNEPGFSQVDLRLYRRFPFAEQQGTGEVYIQIFNLLDTVNYGLVYGRIDSPMFGQGITLAGPPRTVELGLRFSY